MGYYLNGYKKKYYYWYVDNFLNILLKYLFV